MIMKYFPFCRSLWWLVTDINLYLKFNFLSSVLMALQFHVFLFYCFIILYRVQPWKREFGMNFKTNGLIFYTPMSVVPYVFLLLPVQRNSPNRLVFPSIKYKFFLFLVKLYRTFPGAIKVATAKNTQIHKIFCLFATECKNSNAVFMSKVEFCSNALSFLNGHFIWSYYSFSW